MVWSWGRTGLSSPSLLVHVWLRNSQQFSRDRITLVLPGAVLWLCSVKANCSKTSTFPLQHETGDFPTAEVWGFLLWLKCGSEIGHRVYCAASDVAQTQAGVSRFPVCSILGSFCGAGAAEVHLQTPGAGTGKSPRPHRGGLQLLTLILKNTLKSFTLS